MKKINLYHQISVKLNETGIQKLRRYLILEAHNTSQEVEEKIAKIKKDRNLCQMEFWRFIKIFGEDISLPEKERGFDRTKILIKDSKTETWHTLSINETVNVNLTHNGQEVLKSYMTKTRILESSQVRENMTSGLNNNEQRIVLWELINIYGADILTTHPFQQDVITFEKELLLSSQNEYSKSLIPKDDLKAFLTKSAEYLEELKKGETLNNLYQCILTKTNTKYISRRGYAHSKLESSSSKMIESESTFFLEEELDALAHAYGKCYFKEDKIPMAIKKRILKMMKED